jgi:hypothetical protein
MRVLHALLRLRDVRAARANGLRFVAEHALHLGLALDRVAASFSSEIVRPADQIKGRTKVLPLI